MSTLKKLIAEARSLKAEALDDWMKRAKVGDSVEVWRYGTGERAVDSGEIEAIDFPKITVRLKHGGRKTIRAVYFRTGRRGAKLALVDRELEQYAV